VSADASDVTDESARVSLRGDAICGGSVWREVLSLRSDKSETDVSAAVELRGDRGGGKVGGGLFFAMLE